jgi:hypothetical protein
MGFNSAFKELTNVGLSTKIPGFLSPVVTEE